MKLSLPQIVTRGFAQATAVALSVYVIAFTFISMSQTTHERRLASLEHLLTIGLLDAESGQRAYLLTGDKVFLVQYQAGLKALNIYGPVYRDALIDVESTHLYDDLAKILALKRTEMAFTIVTDQNLGHSVAQAIVRNLVGHHYTEDIYRRLHRIREIERDRVAPFQFWSSPKEVDIHDPKVLAESVMLLELMVK